MKILISKEYPDLTIRDIIFGNLEIDTNKTIIKLENQLISLDESEMAEKLSSINQLKKQTIRSVKVIPVRVWKNQKAIVSDDLYRYKI